MMPTSARCFSTASPFRVKDAFSDLYDPVEDEIKASIERKYQESLGMKSGRHRAAAIAARVEARAQRKRELAEASSRSPERQVIQKTALLRDFRTKATPTVEEPAAQAAPAAVGDISLEALNANLADLRAQLAEAEAINWKEIMEETSRSFNLKDLPNYSNMHENKRSQTHKKLIQERTASLQQLKIDRDAHFRQTKQLAESIDALEVFIKQQQQRVNSELMSETKSMKSKTESKAGTGAPTEDGAESVEDAVKRRRLWAIQSRRAELLELKDDIAVKMAQLAAAKVPSPPPAKKWQGQLRLFVPSGKKLIIDDHLIVNFDASGYELAAQVNNMRHRLRKFTPPLDDLPLPVKMSNEAQLRMWLKVLVARYQDKTGVQAGLLDAEGGEWEEVSLAEMHKMSKQRKETTEKETEDKVPLGEMTKAQRKKEKRAQEEELRQARKERQRARRIAYARDLAALHDKGAYPGAIKQAERNLAAKDNAMRDALLHMSPQSPSRPLDEKPIRVVLTEPPATPEVPSADLRAEHLASRLRGQGNVRKMYPSTLRKLVRGYSTSSSRPRSPPSPAPSPSENDTKAAAQGEEQYVPTIRRVLRASKGRSREDVRRGMEGYSTSSRSPPPPFNNDDLSTRLKAFKKEELPLELYARIMDEHVQLTGKEDEQAREVYDRLEAEAKKARDIRLNPYFEQAREQDQPQPNTTHLPHLTPTGTAHMVPITHKPATPRTAIAVGTVYFSNADPLRLITSNTLKKGDVLSVSRIAGIMAAKKCPEIVPLCHPITLTHVGVEVRTFPSTAGATTAGASGGEANSHREGGVAVHGGVQIECKVSCTGATGVEMEALTAVMGAALSVVDMCKAVDRFQKICEVRVVLKEGGKSGVWREEGWSSWQRKDGE